jgi:hypothetical protein
VAASEQQSREMTANDEEIEANETKKKKKKQENGARAKKVLIFPDTWSYHD